MRAPTAILAEDEPVLSDELCQQLKSQWPELRVLGAARSGLEALQMLESQVPDIMFLDIQMPGLTGLEVAQQVRGRCHVVFITAYDAFAVAAFEAGALDYLLKPLDPQRLALALERVRQRLHLTPPSLEPLLLQLAQRAMPRPHLRWIKAAVGDTVQLITVDDVVYFQADSKYTRVVATGGEALIRKPLQELLQELDPSVFWQVHRSIIVNVSAIRTVHRSFRGGLQIRLRERSEELPVSAAHAHLFRQP